MHWLSVVLILLVGAAGAGSFSWILWTRRLKHVWPKRGEIKIVDQGGLVPGIVEVLSQSRVIANRPSTGIMHAGLFFGFLLFGIKSITHVIGGLLGETIELPGVLEGALTVAACVVLTAVVYMGVRRWTVAKKTLTHHLESTVVLSLIALLMVTYLMEKPLASSPTASTANWWVHYLILCGFPSLIAYGKHLHLIMGPVNVVLRHMVERPSDRPVTGADLDMSDEDKFESELARVGMPNGVADFSFHALFDPAACIECGRCNDACPSRDAGLRPRDHFVLSLRDPKLTAEQLIELVPPDTVATCTQCRACDTVCPVGNRPARTALEMRGRMTAQGVYPPRALKQGGASKVTATGNIFGEDPSVREKLIAKNNIPVYDAAEHDVLFVLGCQGAYSPDVQPVVVATARLLEAAGVKYGVLAEETCWGEGLLHGGGLMEDWPMYYQDRIDALTTALGGDRARTILTICPHCRDTIGTQYAQVGGVFTNVRSHVAFLAELVAAGKLKVTPQAEEVATHHPCKIIHNDEVAAMDRLMDVAGVKTHTAGNSPAVPRCCGGGGGGFLWDSPAHVNKARWAQLREETHQKTVVTSCSGCHRMLSVAKEEDAKVVDVANILQARLTEAAKP